MKGYFSRIAKQSGLRFSRGTANERPSIAEPASKNLSPIDVDGTIMVAPSQPNQPTKSERQTSRPKVIGETPTKARDAKRIVEADQPNVAPKHAVPHEHTEKKPEIVETKLITNAPPENVSLPHEQPATALPRQKDVVEAVAVEQTPTKETRSGSEPPEVKKRVLVDGKTQENSSEEKIAIEIGKKEYFAKTAEIIERGDAPAAEIHQILLREVQQWAADPPEPEISELVVEKAEPQITKQIVSPHLEQTQLIEEQNVSEHKETSDLAEQTFELSIGTINVVIEDEKPKQPEEPRANIRNATQQPAREFSRLSRHYL